MPFDNTWIRRRVLSELKARGLKPYDVAKAVRELVPAKRRDAAERAVYGYLSDDAHNITDRNLAPILTALGLELHAEQQEQKP